MNVEVSNNILITEYEKVLKFSYHNLCSQVKEMLNRNNEHGEKIYKKNKNLLLLSLYIIFQLINISILFSFMWEYK